MSSNVQEYDIPVPNCGVVVVGISKVQDGDNLDLYINFDVSTGTPLGFNYYLDGSGVWEYIEQSLPVVLTSPTIGDHTITVKPVCTGACETATTYNFPFNVAVSCDPPVSFSYVSHDTVGNFTFDYELSDSQTNLDIEVTRPDGTVTVYNNTGVATSGSISQYTGIDSIQSGNYRFRLRGVCDATNNVKSTWSDYVDVTSGVYAKIQLDGVYTSHPDSATDDTIADVYVFFYSDANATSPIATSGLTIKWMREDSGGQQTLGEFDQNGNPITQDRIVPQATLEHKVWEVDQYGNRTGGIVEDVSYVYSLQPAPGYTIINS